MRAKLLLPLIGAAALLGCGGGGSSSSTSTSTGTGSSGSGSGSSSGSGSGTSTTPQRGALLTSAKVASYSTADLLGMLTGIEAGTELLSVAPTPNCSFDVYEITYETVGGKGEATTSSGALMVPTGSDSSCQGGLPIVEYAHGTNADKTFDIAAISNSNDIEGLLIAAVFAARGYIVVAPNYAGYDTSTLAYHPYLNGDQQSKEMIDALTAARSALPVSTAPQVTDGHKLFVTGYSQGGYVAMAAHKAMQAAGMTVTASGPMSGPYALSAFGDAVFMGEVTLGSPVNVTLIISSYQNSYGNVYSAPTDVFEANYASTIGSLLPSTTSRSDLYAQGKLPESALFSSTPPSAAYASITPATSPSVLAPAFAMGFGTGNLITNAYRLSLLTDEAAHPDGGYPTLTNGLPPASPANALRQDLKINDLRNWVPTAPTLLCGGDEDPTVLFINTQLMQNYWTVNPPSTSWTVLDVDSAVTSNDAYAAVKEGFAAAKAATAAAGGSNNVLQNYHAALVPPFCLSAVKSFFDGL